MPIELLSECKCTINIAIEAFLGLYVGSKMERFCDKSEWVYM